MRPAFLAGGAALLAGLCTFVAACTSPRGRSAGTIVDPSGQPAARASSPPSTAGSPLARRRIVLDPGHAEPFDGPTLAGGMNEAKLNLYVARRLAVLLAAEGAVVSLTRDEGAPSGLAVRSRSALKEDLAARTVRREEACDLFVSLHHNAVGRTEKPPDEAIVFYRMMEGGDASASARAARCVLDAFERAWRPKRAKRLAGNFSVLRENDVPAILGEPFYVPLPRGKDPRPIEATLEDEARSYAEGIRRYFETGVPYVATFNLATAAAASPRPELLFEVDGDGSPVDPDSVAVEMSPSGGDARPLVSTRVVARTRLAVRVIPAADLPNGRHSCRVTAANLAGGVAYGRQFPFVVDCAIERLQLWADPPVPVRPESDGVASLRLVVDAADRFGRPAADGHRIRLGLAGHPETNRDVELSGGRASAIVPLPEVAVATLRLRATCGTRAVESDLKFDATVRSAWIVGRVISATSSRAIARAQVVPSGPARAASLATRTDAAGGFRLGPLPPAASSPLRVAVSAAGYSPKTISVALASGGRSLEPIELDPIAHGALIGRRVVVEAAVPASSAAGLLAVAVAARFEAAGAQVRMLRKVIGDDDVRRATVERCEMVLRLRPGKRSATALTVAAAFGAADGRALSKRLARALHPVVGKSVTLRRVADPASLHMPCPAVMLAATAKLRPEQVSPAADAIVSAVADFLANDGPNRAERLAREEALDRVRLDFPEDDEPEPPAGH